MTGPEEERLLRMINRLCITNNQLTYKEINKPHNVHYLFGMPLDHIADALDYLEGNGALDQSKEGMNP